MKTTTVQKQTPVGEIHERPVIKPLSAHPSAANFPDLSILEFLALKDDIRINGQQNPIICLNGKIIDGRQRYRALQELRIEPKVVELETTATPEQVLISNNLLRRHLTESQRAMIGAKLVTTVLGSNQSAMDSVTQSQAARQTGISIDTIQRASKVLASGDKTLIRLVESDRMPVNKAASLARLPIETLATLMKAANDFDFDAMVTKTHREMIAQKSRAIMAKVDAKRANNRPLDVVDGKFGVICIDPPWDYIDEKATGYPTMSREELLKLEVGKKATENAVCFMWAPASQLPLALELMAAWGFQYKTSAVWDKEKAGLGVYFRARHEMLLLGTRGTLPEVPAKNRLPSVFLERRREHSRKPEFSFHLIEQMYPDLAKLEMFCRGKARDGWVAWGNECVLDVPAAHAVTDKEVKPRLSLKSSPAIKAGERNPDPIVEKRRVGRPANDSKTLKAA